MNDCKRIVMGVSNMYMVTNVKFINYSITWSWFPTSPVAQWRLQHMSFGLFLLLVRHCNCINKFYDF